MTLDDFLAHKSPDRKQTDWLHLCDFAMKGRRMLAIDPGPGGDPVAVEVEPGDFVVEVKGMILGADTLIARMRVRAKNSSPKLGKSLGTTGIDDGTLAVFDDEPITTFMESDEEGYAEWMDEHLFMLDGPCGVVPCEPAGTTVPYVETGFGDGSYPAYELTDDSGQVVGLEVEFIKPGQTSPFQDDDM